MLTFRLLYFPRDSLPAPRPADLKAQNILAVSARHAARIAASLERRAGARVLTVTEVR